MNEGTNTCTEVFGLVISCDGCDFRGGGSLLLGLKIDSQSRTFYFDYFSSANIGS